MSMTQLTCEDETLKARYLFGLMDPAAQLSYFRAHPQSYIEANLYIRTKQKTIIPFLLKPPQIRFAERQTKRDMILKARQMGFTTEICALFFADTVLNENTTSVIVAHDSDSTQRIFQIVKLFWERLPEHEKVRIGEPHYSNRRELWWPQINSWFYVGTAGSTSFGRGQTINNLHCSELAFWPDPETKLSALLEAVPADGHIVYESTPNGMGNYFHDLWVRAKAGENGFEPHFFAWYDDSTNTAAGDPLGELTSEEQEMQARLSLTYGQLRWRRQKQRDLRDLFVQEHVENDVSCFLASGRGVFDRTKLLKLLQHIQERGDPDSLASLPWPSGRAGHESAEYALAPATLRIYQAPEAGRSYVIGADVAEGLASGDASAACVLDRETGEQVAELHGRVIPEKFAYQLAALGWYYNKALIGVERNNHGHSTLNTLLNVIRYEALYYHLPYDAPKGSEVLGWPTTPATRPVLVDDLAAAIAGECIPLRSSATIDEMFCFIVTASGKPEAEQGKYDDRVMAAGIAWQIRNRVKPWFANSDLIAKLNGDSHG